MNKSDLRVEALRVRANLRVHADDAEAAAAHFMRDMAPAPGTCVALYWPIKYELDTLPLMAALHAAGCRVALPVIPPKHVIPAQAGISTSPDPGFRRDDDRILKFRIWTPEIDLVPGVFNIPVPPEEGAAAVVPDIVVAPVLAFDRRGTRLGMGGGYYDRTVAHLRADGAAMPLIGYAYAEQICLFPLPRLDHDIAMEAVVTPQGVQRF